MGNKKGTCTNCGRRNLTIVNKEGHCSSCYAASRDKAGKAREEALRNASKRLGFLRPDSPAQGKEEIPPKDIHLDNTSEAAAEKTLDELSSCPEPAEDKGQTTNPRQVISPETLTEADLLLSQQVQEFLGEAHDVIFIEFGPDDQNLLDYITVQAKKYRRSPDQQILYMIDCNRQADLEVGCSK